MVVKIFGQLSDVIGSNSLEVNGITNTDDLVKNLQLQYPALADSKYRLAVNRNIIQSNINLQTGAEVALLPPFSGG